MLNNEYTEDAKEELKDKTTILHEAFFSNPTNEFDIVDVMTSTNNEERQLIRSNYKLSYGHPIQNDINAQLKDNLRQILIDMFDTPYEYDARELHTSLNSLMNDESVIIEIFASRPSSYLSIVDLAYSNFFKISLKDEISKHIGGEFAQYLIALMEEERPNDQTISGNDAYQIADNLINGDLVNIGTDVNKFKEIFIQKSREDLILISRAYYEKCKNSIYDDIETLISGKIRKLLKAIIFAVITPAEWFAKKLEKSLHDTNTIRRILISRSEIDMYAIRDYYYMDTSKELYTDIGQESNDAYAQIMTNLSKK